MTKRYDALDSLRGVCACMVVLFHIQSSGFINKIPFVQGGWLFVDFFFVLSGFVISASYGRRLIEGFPLGHFVLLRFGRIYPLHIAVLGGFFFIEVAAFAVPAISSRPAFSGARQISDLMLNVALLQIFNPPHGLTWNAPAWSIAAEFWTYLTAGSIFAFGGRCRPYLLAAMITLPFLWLSSTPNYLSHAADFGFLRCFYGFGLGALSFNFNNLFQKNIQNFSPYGATAIEIAISSASLILASFSEIRPLSMIAPPLFTVVVAVFSAERGYISKILLKNPMRNLGIISYSLYMTHIFIIGKILDCIKYIFPDFIKLHNNGVKEIIGPPLASDTLVFLILLIIVATSAATYHLIERPGREWSRIIAERWSPHSRPYPNSET